MSDEVRIFNNGGIGINVAPTGGAHAIAVVDGTHVDTNGNGMIVNGTGGIADAVFRDSTASRNTNFGVQATSSASKATAFVQNSTMAFNAGTGFNVSGGQGFGFIGSSTVTGNGTGVSATGTLQSFKNNQIANNTTDGTPINPFPGPGGTPLQ